MRWRPFKSRSNSAKKKAKKAGRNNTKGRGKRAPQSIEQPKTTGSAKKVTAAAPKKSEAAKPIKHTTPKKTEKAVTPKDVVSGWRSSENKKGSEKK